MTTVIPFAGLAPDPRPLRGRGALRDFDVEAALEMGHALRSASVRGRSTREVAALLVDAINALEEAGRAACVLVRVFVTRAFGELPPELQAQVRAEAGSAALPAELACLQLWVTRGSEPAWNDEARSNAHRALLLERSRAPMIAELERQLRIGDSAQPATGTFHIADAVASAAVPAKAFVQSYGVKSVFGFGLRAWPGETAILIAFSRTSLERKTLKALEMVALYARSAWLGSTEAAAALDAVSCSESRADNLSELLTLHENNARERFADYHAQLRASHVESERAAAELERHNHDLRRTQRAMLNVIEDLRDARAALASKVELRTRELADANAQLESRNRELEEFVYIASHDLQEPLRTVAGYLQMIERRYATQLSAEADEFIRFAIEGAQRMQALIESLLLYSRVTKSERSFEAVSLQDCFETALSNLALRVEETRASIACEPLPTIQADRMQMVQLFQNLLSNALKFAGDRPPRVQVSARVEAARCTIVVRDHGIGFPMRFAERIFNVFRRLRRDTEGTGIGLAVCKKIAERHGGRILAESTPGEGATFSVELALDPGLRGNP